MLNGGIFDPNARRFIGDVYDSYEEAAADIDDRLTDCLITSFDDGLQDDWVWVIIFDQDEVEVGEKKFPSKGSAQRGAEAAAALRGVTIDAIVFVCHEDDVDQEIEDRLTALGRKHGT